MRSTPPRSPAATTARRRPLKLATPRPAALTGAEHAAALRELACLLPHELAAPSESPASVGSSETDQVSAACGTLPTSIRSRAA